MWSNNNQPAPAVDWPRQGRAATRDLPGKSGSEVSPPNLDTRAGRRSEPALRSKAASTATVGQNARPAVARVPQNLPLEIGFLAHYGMAYGTLVAAAAKARAQGVTAEAVLLAEGEISEHHFYSLLARYLRLDFVEGRVTLASAAHYPQSVNAGLAPLVGSDGPAFLAAPRGAAIIHLMQAMRHDNSIRSRLALTTPTHLYDLVRAAARAEISRKASLALWYLDPALSAKGGLSRRQKHNALAMGALIAVSFAVAPSAAGTVCEMFLGLAFVAVIWLRLAACAASAVSCNLPVLPLRPLKQAELPIYSIVVALYREARIIPQLLAAMGGIDYPRAKLDFKFVIEEDDTETFAALIKAGCPGCEIVVAPAGMPRTKPRALNVALPLVRGRYVAIFDAEDVPDPGQIKMAAQRFAAAPQRLGCLQARLAIDNAGDGWLTRGIMAQTPEGQLSEPGSAVRARHLRHIHRLHNCQRNDIQN
jgi:glycosyltransferase XagB